MALKVISFFSDYSANLKYLQKVAELPAIYMALRNLAIDCIDHVRLDEEATRVFETAIVRDLLSSVMGLIIKGLEFISRYYSMPFFSKSFVMNTVGSVLMPTQSGSYRVQRK